jgi:HTH-type transcriptional regulator/antitoxin HigA
MKYTVIKTRDQYNSYCKMLEELTTNSLEDIETLDEIDLLTLLIEKWDDENAGFNVVDPVHLLRSLMRDHGLKSKDLASVLDVGPSLISEILNYRKAFSKQIIRRLAAHFKLRAEAFSKPYHLNPSKREKTETQI